MARAIGVMNPDNAAQSTVAFKEGVVRIDANCYKVHKSKVREGQTEADIATKWSWNVTRMNETGDAVLTDEQDAPLTDELLFSFGGKSIPFVHPGKAESPDDEEVEDAGTSVGTEGNTIYLNAADWTPNPKSGLLTLTRSMAALGTAIKPEYLNRCWCPDWVGCVFEMKTQLGEKGRDGKEIPYKVVAKVLVGPGSTKGKKGVNGVAVAPKAVEAETFLAPILNALSRELDGQQLTRKAFVNRVRGALEKTNADAKILVPVLSLCKDDKWLAAHADTFDYVLRPEDNSIVFGELAAIAY